VELKIKIRPAPAGQGHTAAGFGYHLLFFRE
jgi:hypothetical protein